ncbi:arginine/lysine/ornithine decarboxylase [Paucibacter oligotrophus]|uniref:Arginine/lysine/ornithine decarboxylase n=1 Tax=Roseateles oligotrophus TaxID=1769250 RepID=A0A840L5I3_9BURK|nr:Orn/Lys/Arg decarboxylase N-terminal domain-containing protein [Roseateles oligotrophus]MBB4843460.1 arginine/lysine/ornithine decarboxylase [Roseateles oligotrophus]
MTHGTLMVEMRALLISDELGANSALGRSLQSLSKALSERDIVVLEANTAEDAKALISADPGIQCMLLSWNMSQGADAHSSAQEILQLIRSRNSHVPVVLMAGQDGQQLNAQTMRQIDELIWFLEDTTAFIAGRVLAAIERYRAAIAPPFTRALIDFARKYEYSWHTPGHAGGTAFLKSPVGAAFHDYFGENLLRSDLSISVGELGSLLDHSGPIGESEKYCAKIFGGDRAYTVTNGSSMSNRVIMMASVTRGDYALCDRNAHKSTEQALTMTGVVPTYLRPSRNHLGIIGPIHAQTLGAEAVQAAIQANPLAQDKSRKAIHAIVTNSTYDGLIYKVPRVVELLDKSVDRIHFDEAWYGYARFNPLYRDRFGMYGEARDYPRDKPTIFTTTSTHKLLAALSQSSLINVRDGRNPVPHARFNESYMMHASTSPLYAIIASNEVSAAMMSGVGGVTMTQQSIQEAVNFRKALWRLRRDAQRAGDWFFSTWNADTVIDPASGKSMAFEDAPTELLVSEPSCWVLHPGQAWHGFADIEADYCMLDPIKVSIVSPGVAEDGSFEASGIPAMLVTAFLSQRGIQVEKTTDFTILVLFSLGVTRGKFGTLVNALLRFKEAYDANTPVAEVLYAPGEAVPEAYLAMGLKDLAAAMFEQMRSSDILRLQALAFSSLPVPVMTPADAYAKLVHDEIEEVAVDELAGRVLANAIVPYPPGIPMLMPGEAAGAADGPFIGYLRGLQDWGERFPGFGRDTHGVEMKNGRYFVQCLK